jgi:hypothetical protein
MTREGIICLARHADREWDCDRNMMEWVLEFGEMVARAEREQSEWQGLTDEEIEATANSLGFYGVRSKDFARLIEAKLKERNV